MADGRRRLQESTNSSSRWCDRVLIYVDSSKPGRCWPEQELHRSRSLGCLDETAAVVGRPLGRYHRPAAAGGVGGPEVVVAAAPTAAARLRHDGIDVPTSTFVRLLQQQASAAASARCCSSQSELMGSQMSMPTEEDGFDFSCCSVNNLQEADLVSPMVSTNSLAATSQMGDLDDGSSWNVEFQPRAAALAAAGSGGVDAASGRPIVDGSPVPSSVGQIYGRPSAARCAAAADVSRLFPHRQLTSIIAGGRYGGGSLLLVSRSTSCPSVHAAHPSHSRRSSPVFTATAAGSAILTATAEQPPPVTPPSSSSDGRPSAPPLVAATKSEVANGNLAAGATDLSAVAWTVADDRKTSTQTAPVGVKTSSANGPVDASRSLDVVQKPPPPASPSSNKIPDNSSTSSQPHPMTADRRALEERLKAAAVSLQPSERRGGQSPPARRSTPSPHRGSGGHGDGDQPTTSPSSTVANGGRELRSLARTKCLQWLNSLDEDE